MLSIKELLESGSQTKTELMSLDSASIREESDILILDNNGESFELDEYSQLALARVLSIPAQFFRESSLTIRGFLLHQIIEERQGDGVLVAVRKRDGLVVGFENPNSIGITLNRLLTIAQEEGFEYVFGVFEFREGPVVDLVHGEKRVRITQIGNKFWVQGLEVLGSGYVISVSEDFRGSKKSVEEVVESLKGCIETVLFKLEEEEVDDRLERIGDVVEAGDIVPLLMQEGGLTLSRARKLAERNPGISTRREMVEALVEESEGQSTEKKKIQLQEAAGKILRMTSEDMDLEGPCELCGRNFS